MNNFNEYQCLRKIYAKLIIGASLLPFVIASLGSLSIPFLVISSIIIIITNIYIYAKFYKKNDIGLFNENIGSLLKKTMISFLIVIISLLPIFYTYTIIGSGGYYSMLTIGILSLFLGMLISSIYYVYNVIKLYKNLDQSLFYLDEMDNTPRINQFELLKTIYSKYIVLTLIAPFIMFYSYQLMIFYVITANLFMFVKYYKKTEDNLIHDSFKKILNVTILAAIIVVISYMPILSNLLNLIDILNNHGKDFLKVIERQKTSIIIMYIGFFIGWASCLYVLIKNFKINDDKSNSVTNPELVNTINNGEKND